MVRNPGMKELGVMTASISGHLRMFAYTGNIVNIIFLIMYLTSVKVLKRIRIYEGVSERDI